MIVYGIFFPRIFHFIGTSNKNTRTTCVSSTSLSDKHGRVFAEPFVKGSGICLALYVCELAPECTFPEVSLAPDNSGTKAGCCGALQISPFNRNCAVKPSGSKPVHFIWFVCVSSSISQARSFPTFCGFFHNLSFLKSPGHLSSVGRSVVWICQPSWFRLTCSSPSSAGPSVKGPRCAD